MVQNSASRRRCAIEKSAAKNGDFFAGVKSGAKQDSRKETLSEGGLGGEGRMRECGERRGRVTE